MDLPLQAAQPHPQDWPRNRPWDAREACAEVDRTDEQSVDRCSHQLNAIEKTPAVGTEETTMPAAHGHRSGITCPAASAEKSLAKISLVVAAPPTVAKSLSTMLPAPPGATQISVAQIPGAAFITCAAVILIALLTPPGSPGEEEIGPTSVAGIQFPLVVKVPALRG
jgi:hypothetical protein